MAESRPVALLAVNARGARAALILQAYLPGSVLYIPDRLEALFAGTGDGRIGTYAGSMAAAVGSVFAQCDGMVFFLAAGAVVRLIAPHLGDKWSDPAVVCVDETCRHAVSLLSGHAGGANTLTCLVASALGAEPVVTTASDCLGWPAADLIGQQYGWRIEGLGGEAPPLRATAAAVVDGEQIGVFQDAGEGEWWAGPLPEQIAEYSSLEDLVAARPSAALVITDKLLDAWRCRLPEQTVVYRPQVLTLGIGCRRGATAAEIAAHARRTLQAAGLAESSVATVATADFKAREPGLRAYAAMLDVPVSAYSVAELRDVYQANRPDMCASSTVERLVGIPAVCEVACLAGAGPGGKLVVRKSIAGSVTCAVARNGRAATSLPAPDPRSSRNSWSGDKHRAGGSLTVVGIGPGHDSLLPPLARAAIDRAGVVVGLRRYLDEIGALTIGKRVQAADMGDEVGRAGYAVEQAQCGQRVVLVSSGDAGVYGMAGLVYEVLERRGWSPEALDVSVVPGISAMHAAAALLGAPLMHDTAVISLSDLLTPGEIIVRRLEAAAAADFVLALYNPASKRRHELLSRARAILMAHRAGTTPVGLVRNAYRADQRVLITTLEALPEQEVDMLTIVVVGNSATRILGQRMFTPRGYAARYDLADPGPSQALSQSATAGNERRE